MQRTKMVSNISESDRMTQQLGEQFAQELRGGDVILLYGDLGAGKTTFTKGLAKGLGITERIISPTFILTRKHILDIPKKDIKILYHLDLYRLPNTKKGQEIGLDELFEDKNAVVVVEWAEHLENVPKTRWEVRLKHFNERERSITIEKK